jgi:hypothetical protein
VLSSVTRVSTLGWDSKNNMLFIGGRFDKLGDAKIPGGVCVWTEESGLMRFPSKGIGFGLSAGMSNGEITHMAYEATSQVAIIILVHACLEICLIRLFAVLVSLCGWIVLVCE